MLLFFLAFCLTLVDYNTYPSCSWKCFLHAVILLVLELWAGSDSVTYLSQFAVHPHCLSECMEVFSCMITCSMHGWQYLGVLALDTVVVFTCCKPYVRLPSNLSWGSESASSAGTSGSQEFRPLAWTLSHVKGSEGYGTLHLQSAWLLDIHLLRRDD